MTTVQSPPAPAPDAPARPTPLEILARASYGHLANLYPSHWGEFGKRGRGLRFTSTGLARMAHIVGWILGIALADNPLAEKLAADFCNKLDYLDGYGGPFNYDDPICRQDRPLQLPRYLVELSDDGTFAGFSVLWFVNVPKDRLNQLPALDAQHLRWHQTCYGTRVPYVFSMNGGLLFHGFTSDRCPGGYPLLAVRLGDSTDPWSIHT